MKFKVRLVFIVPRSCLLESRESLIGSIRTYHVATKFVAERNDCVVESELSGIETNVENYM